VHHSLILKSGRSCQSQNLNSSSMTCLFQLSAVCPPACTFAVLIRVTLSDPARTNRCPKGARPFSPRDCIRCPSVRRPQTVPCWRGQTPTLVPPASGFARSIVAIVPTTNANVRPPPSAFPARAAATPPTPPESRHRRPPHPAAAERPVAASIRGVPPAERAPSLFQLTAAIFESRCAPTNLFFAVPGAATVHVPLQAPS